MKRINFKRVIPGGLVMGVVFMIVEFVAEGLVCLFGVSERDLLLQANSDTTISGTRYQIVNLTYFFVFCFFAIWLYASLRPRFGADSKTAIITSLVLFFTGFLVAVNFVNMGIFSLKLTLVGLLFNLVELPTALLFGACIYKEEAVAA